MAFGRFIQGVLLLRAESGYHKGGLMRPNRLIAPLQTARSLMCLLIIVGFVVAAASPSVAHRVPLSFQDCSFSLIASRGENVVLGFSNERGAFPPDSYYNGVKNSFFDRMRAGAIRWSDPMFEQSAGHGVEYRGPDFFHVVVFYEARNNPGATSYLKEGDDRSLCTVHGLDEEQIIQSTISMQSRGDWFYTRGHRESKVGSMRQWRNRSLLQQDSRLRLCLHA